MTTVKVKFRKSIVDGKTGTVYYQICHASLCGQITTNIHLLPSEWDEENGAVRTSTKMAKELRLQKYRLKLESDVKQLHQIIRSLEERMDSYTVSDVKQAFQSHASRISVLSYMELHIQKLKRHHHLGTAKNYQCALHSLSDFLGGEELSFNQLNEGLVMEYNDYLEGRGLVKNSISFYMRIWRAIYNRAVKERIVDQNFPFQSVYTGIDHTRKRALPEDAINKLMALDLKRSPSLDLSRDLFIFSYCTRGMAFVDIAYLKKKNIDGNKIIYNRRKTNQLMMIKIEPCTLYLIEKYKERTADSVYVFPILNAVDENTSYRQYMLALSMHNLKLKKLASLAGITTSLSSYIPRHTWATVARNHHVPISIISAGMGHSSEKTTEIYLASLENTVVDDANSGLLEHLNKLFSF